MVSKCCVECSRRVSTTIKVIWGSVGGGRQNESGQPPRSSLHDILIFIGEQKFKLDLSTCLVVITIGEVAGMSIGVLSCALDVFVGLGFADVSAGTELCPWWNQNTWPGGNEAFFPNGIIRLSEHVSYVWVDAKAVPWKGIYLSSLTRL